MSWREKTERRRARTEVEDRRYQESEGVGLNRFIRLLALPAVVVIILVATQATLSKVTLFALGGLGLILLIGFVKATRKRHTTPSRGPDAEPAAGAENTIWDRSP